MRVCANCFNDEEIQNYIKSEGKKDICDIHKIEEIVIELDDLSDFFHDIFSLFKNDNNSKKTIYDIVQEDWNLFSNINTAKTIIDEEIKSLDAKINSSNVEYIDVITNYVNIWQRLKNDLQYKNRFLINLESYNPIDPYLQNCLNANDVIVILPKGKTLYRARVLPDKKRIYKKEELGCPPNDKVLNGRANPIGIPYLYLCDNKETTYYEVRARYKDRVAIGDFKIKKDLRIIALTSIPSLYLSSCLHSGIFIDDIKNKLLLHDIAVDMSKPLSRYDTELEYVPTQFICELCKFNKADGISFKSSLYNNGINYVLFSANDTSVAECVNIKTTTIEHVEINDK